MATKAQETRTHPTKTTTRAPRTAAQRRSRTNTATMFGVAAAGLATGLLANLGRKVAVQAPSALAGDWFEAIKAEHRAALALFDAIEATEEVQVRRRGFLLMQLKHALAKHAFTEENVIYPALREWGDKADADKLNHDHGYVKQFLYTLDSMAKDSPDFLLQVSEFRETLEAHIHEEEEQIFPQLHAALSEEKNKTLTSSANREGFKLA
ncbi:hypothetical protein ACFB49_44330 [Sphingomonas sp. DBB INV C78]|uniref:hemerythrin domain-containing protein n=1 Tax=Sphingomonas sp. DBB INV C78 TaxID=3349434 RepID=UPI0036D30F0B